MNIAGLKGLNQITNLKQTSFRQNYKTFGVNSFEISEIQADEPVSYPKSIKCNFLKGKRRKAIEAVNIKQQQNTLKKKAIGLEFVEFQDRIFQIFDEIEEKMNRGILSIKNINKKLEDSSLNESQKEQLEKMKQTLKDEIKTLIEEYEILNQKARKFYEAGKADIIDVSDKRIELPQENIDYYKNL